MAELLQILISGLAAGSIYALAAVGFTLLWQASQTINFAQGEFVMLPAFFVLIGMTVFGLPLWLSIVLGLGLALPLDALLGLGLVRDEGLLRGVARGALGPAARAVGRGRRALAAGRLDRRHEVALAHRGGALDAEGPGKGLQLDQLHAGEVWGFAQRMSFHGADLRR